MLSDIDQVTYEYDALGRRIQRLHEDLGFGFGSGGGEGELSSIGGSQRPAVKPGEPTIEAAIGVSEGDDYYYSDKWQVVEDRVGGEVKSQYVWSERYVDALVLRDRDWGSSSC